MKHDFKRGYLGLIIKDNRHDSAMDRYEPGRKRIRGIDTNHTALHKNTIGAIAFDDAVSGNP